jgi:hypothetical protein
LHEIPKITPWFWSHWLSLSRFRHSKSVWNTQIRTWGEIVRRTFYGREECWYCAWENLFEVERTECRHTITELQARSGAKIDMRAENCFLYSVRIAKLLNDHALDFTTKNWDCMAHSQIVCAVYPCGKQAQNSVSEDRMTGTDNGWNWAWWLDKRIHVKRQGNR